MILKYFASNMVLQALGQAASPADMDIYIALLSAAPTLNSAGEVTALNELTSAGGYTRKHIDKNTNGLEAYFGNVTYEDGVTSITNTKEIHFDISTGAYSAAATHFALINGATGNNVLFYGALSSSVTVSAANKVPVIQKNSLTITVQSA